jgi:hypothetical protein
MIEHSTNLDMMRQLGFNEKWHQWTVGIFNIASTSVLLNGVPSKYLNYKRGVRQGDPLYPLLFVLAANLIQCIINKACQ